MVVDRGIYSLETFKGIINDPGMHMVTWEKDYKKDKWDDNATRQTGSIIKVKNKKGDHKLVHYRYQERTWEKEPGIKQIIVRIYIDNKNWKVKMELSIITDDKDRNTNESVVLMLTRWVQENDFKYMIKHFGLNQITSYAFTDYRALRDKLEDKLYICALHKSLTKEIDKVRAKFKTALLAKHNFDQKYGNIEQEKLPKKQRERKANIAAKVNALYETLTKLEKERSETPKFVSKLDELIALDFKKLDTDTKSFMDAIKLLARNMFYLAFQPFKEKYNNYRDDHFLFRQLIMSGGTIMANDNGYKIQLQPQIEYQPKVQKIITEVLNQINDGKPQMPDRSGENIELELKI